jgi:hypothetical protein
LRGRSLGISGSAAATGAVAASGAGVEVGGALFIAEQPASERAISEAKGATRAVLFMAAFGAERFQL